MQNSVSIYDYAISKYVKVHAHIPSATTATITLCTEAQYFFGVMPNLFSRRTAVSTVLETSRSFGARSSWPKLLILTGISWLQNTGFLFLFLFCGTNRFPFACCLVYHTSHLLASVVPLKLKRWEMKMKGLICDLRKLCSKQTALPTCLWGTSRAAAALWHASSCNS